MKAGKILKITNLIYSIRGSFLQTIMIKLGAEYLIISKGRRNNV